MTRKNQTCASGVGDSAGNYRRLHRVLVSRARWLGSRNPEDAAQEALKRSLENSNSQPAMEYYLSEEEPAPLQSPEWSLEQLLAWLHGVLHYIVREEYSRLSTRREVFSGGIGSENAENGRLNPVDPAPNQLEELIQRELHKIVADCLPALEREYRTVLKMRVDGMTYGEIARKLGVKENTVATWVSRGIRALGQRVRNRTERFGARPQSAQEGIPDA